MCVQSYLLLREVIKNQVLEPREASTQAIGSKELVDDWAWLRRSWLAVIKGKFRCCPKLKAWVRNVEGVIHQQDINTTYTKTLTLPNILVTLDLHAVAL